MVSTAIYKKGQVDFSSEMLRAKEAGAEMLYAGGVIGENVAMVKELERLGLKIPVGISFVSRVPVALKLMGSAGENVHVLDYVVAEESDKGRAFLDKAKGLLSDEDFKRVNRFTFTGYAGAKVMLDQSGIPLEVLNMFESWAVALTLSVTAIQKLGLTPENGVETLLSAQFKSAKKPISGLETTEQQLGFFDTLPEEAQRTFLASAIDETADLKKEFDGMIASWAAGDEAKIALTFDDELQLSPELLDRLLRQRNANWAVWIKDRMAKPGTTFIAVGAGHLAGKDSVQAMLAAKGLVVTRVQ